MPLGVSTGRVHAFMISASSSLPPHYAYKGRLHSEGVWCADPNDTEPYWRVDLGSEYEIESLLINDG